MISDVSMIASDDTYFDAASKDKDPSRGAGTGAHAGCEIRCQSACHVTCEIEQFML
jgi:hypothetical protein